MPQYLISVLARGPELATAEEMAAIDVFNEALVANGHWVYANGLGTLDEATFVDARGEVSQVTPGRANADEEFVAGFWIIEAPEDATALDLAVGGSKSCNRRVLLRPFAR